MKQYSLIFSFMLFSSLSFSQNFTETFLKVDLTEAYKGPSAEMIRQKFRYEVYPSNIPAKPVSRKELSAAKSMLDLMKEYPTTWVSNYISTEILVVSNGKEKRAAGSDGTLNKAQRALLKIADFNTKVTINVKYKQENSATRKIEVSNLNYAIAVIPDTEAVYPGGAEALEDYLKKNAIDPISDADLRKLERGTVQFMINEKGQVEDVELVEKIGNPKVDQLLLQVIRKMPEWKPAKDENGRAVKQEFKFVVGGMNGGC
jgi:TonB family protein